MDHEHKSYLNSLCVAIDSPQAQKSFFFSVIQETLSSFCANAKKTAQGKPAKHKKIKRQNFNESFDYCFSNEQKKVKKRHSGNRRLQFKKIITLPKYQASQNLTSQIDSHKKEINRKIFAKANCLVDKTFYSPLFNFSKSQASFLDGVKAFVSLSKFVKQLRRKNTDVPGF